MREHPILFSAPMIRAILDGRKTMTRRVIKNVPEILMIGQPLPELVEAYKNAWIKTCPYQPGDHLWVREAWGVAPCYNIYAPRNIPLSSRRHVDYKADGPEYWGVHADKWRPSIFMPRWASRITLEVEAVRVERLQDITEEDAVAEGFVSQWDEDADSSYEHGPSARELFAALWDSLNAKRNYGWVTNPFVWVITFKRTSS